MIISWRGVILYKKKKKGFYNDMVSAKCKLIFHVILLNYSYITVSKNEIVFQ